MVVETTYLKGVRSFSESLLVFLKDFHIKKQGDVKIMAKMGRPRVEIDQKLFENLCAIMCTEEEIAGMFDCCIDTVNNWCKRTYGATFSDTYKIYSAKGRSSLRRLQYQSAQAGSVPMQIWLGKNWLGQKDQIETTAPETAINIQVSPATADDIEEF